MTVGLDAAVADQRQHVARGAARRVVIDRDVMLSCFLRVFDACPASYQPLLRLTMRTTSDNHRHLDEHADHGGQRSARLEAEQADRGRHRQFEEIARADQAAGQATLCDSFRRLAPSQPS